MEKQTNESDDPFIFGTPKFLLGCEIIKFLFGGTAFARLIPARSMCSPEGERGEQKRTITKRFQTFSMDCLPYRHLPLIPPRVYTYLR